MFDSILNARYSSMIFGTMHYNQPRFLFFFFYLSIFRLDIVPRPRPSFIGKGWKKKKKKRKRFSKVSIQRTYRETRKHFVIFLRLVFPRHNDFSRSNVFDRNTADMAPIVPFLWFPIPISRTNSHSPCFKTIRNCIASANETVSPFREHTFHPLRTYT